MHFYWIGAIPAMVFLGIVMMPFYYGSKVRSVPEYLLRRFGKAAHLFNAIAFAFATILIAGVNLYALALVLQLLLGWPILARDRRRGRASCWSTSRSAGCPRRSTTRSCSSS